MRSSAHLLGLFSEIPPPRISSISSSSASEISPGLTNSSLSLTPLRSPLCQLSLQAEAISSPESHFFYLRFKQTDAPFASSSGHSTGMMPKAQCRLLSSTIAKITPGSVAIVTGILTVSSPSPFPLLGSNFPHETSATDYTSQSRAIERIVFLNGGAQRCPPSVLVALSTLIHLRIHFSEQIPSTSASTAPPRVQLEENVPLSDMRSTLRPHLSFCGILSIPPKVHHPFDHSKYLQECQKSFAPLSVVPIFPEGHEEEEVDYLKMMISRVPDQTISLQSVLSSPRSYFLPTALGNDQELTKIREILATHSSWGALVTHSRSDQLLPELSMRSLGPLLSLSCPTPRAHLLLHVHSPMGCSRETNSFLSSLRHDLLTQSSNPHTALTSVKFTKGAVRRLLRSMELAVQSLLFAIKSTATAWREMNLLKSQSHRGREGGRESAEGRHYLGSRLFTTNFQLWEDILQSQYACDEAMITYLLALQQSLRE